MTPALTPTKLLARVWKALGAPRDAGSALVMGPQGFDLARAVREVLGADGIVLLHPDPAPSRARFETTTEDLVSLSRSRARAFDLAAVGGGLEDGDLSHVRDRVQALAAVLKPGGVLAAAIDTMAAPDSQNGSYDHLLFPHLARAGDLGDALQARALVPPSAWRALLQAAGFEILAVEGARGQLLPPDLRTMHEPRLSAYDAVELAGGVVRVVARKVGSAS